MVGTDISAEMVEAARRRCEGLASVEFRHVSGRDLCGFGDASFGLVLAVDAFPYIVQSGASLAERMLAECARVLRPGGQLVILNYSYRRDVERDRRELLQFAQAQSLELVRNGTSDFALWDGVAFQLRKP
jgi:ubiquinone/menaquinone biosynthesis C-methylase UbiE